MRKKISFDSLILILIGIRITFVFVLTSSIYGQNSTGTVTDIDGNVYNTVKIGDQWWMAENLKVTHYRNGDVIPNITDGNLWIILTTGAYGNYYNDTNNVAIYGRLYNWYAVNDSRNIAPEGWHVPNDAEWKQLEMYLGMSQTEADKSWWRGTNEGNKLKEAGNAHWYSSSGTNESGFSALPGGYRNYADGGHDYYMREIGYFWNSSGGSRLLRFDNSKINREITNPQVCGFSVRCVKDSDVPFQSFSFAHLTDIHVGWVKIGFSKIELPLKKTTAFRLFAETLQDIKRQNWNPDFVVITGDLVESAKDNGPYFNQLKAALANFKKNLGREIPDYLVPGNHDRYERSPSMDYSLVPGNDHLNQYYTSLGRPDIPYLYVNIFNDFDEWYPTASEFSNEGLDWYNYSFEHQSGYLFIGLDSGADADWYPETTPEGKGLHDLQISELNNLANIYHLPKIIFMHHPIYPDSLDSECNSYINESIIVNRNEFINYCNTNNVRLVLSGHTHRSFTYNDGMTQWVTTPSAVKDDDPRGYRIITVENEDSVTTPEYTPTPFMKPFVYQAKGSLELHAYDLQGRHTGFGSITADIPNSYYTGYYNPLTWQEIILFDGIAKDYKFEAKSQSSGLKKTEIAGTDAGFAEISLYADDLIIQMQDLPLSTTTIDKMYFQEDSTFVYTTSDPEKDFSVSLGRELEDKSRIFLVSNTSISSIDSAKFKILDNQSLKFSNIGSPKTYDVRLIQVGVDSGEFAFTDLSLGENETQIISPTDWQDLDGQPVQIFIDEGMDGTPDDTLFVENQLASVSYSFAQAGWYMLSLSVEPEDKSLTRLFPSTLAAFEWNGHEYISVDSLETEKGYWLAMPSSWACALKGKKIDSYTRHYRQGWHLIGSVIDTVDFSNPNDQPDGSVLTPAYCYDTTLGQYVPADTLIPGQGYWIAVLQECDLTLGETSTSLAKTIAQADKASFYQRCGSQPPPPPNMNWKIGELTTIPNEFVLLQNYPNPFNPETIIKYQLPKGGKVTFQIYDILGRLVRTLVNNEQQIGYYELRWDGKDDQGLSMPSGLYFYRIQAGEFQGVKKLLLIK